MSERLQNIINGINDGSIKFVFDYNLTMEDLFTKDNKSIVESIYENLEIIDLLCNSNNYFYLNYLSQEIITKLITKDNNGIYPIEKYLNNKRLIEKIMPSINDINVLLEICNRNNDYDLIKAVKARMLITNYKDDKTILLFLLNDKKVVPDCLINIPEDIIFIKYLIKNNLYDYLSFL